MPAGGGQRKLLCGLCWRVTERDVVGAVLRDLCQEMGGLGGGRCPRCGVLQPPGGRGMQPGCVLGLRPPRPSQVRFSRPESEQARQRRVQSYEFLQKKHAEEPWVHLHYYGLRVSRGPQGGPGSKAWCPVWPHCLTVDWFHIEW